MIKQTRIAVALSSCLLAACSSTAYQQAQKGFSDSRSAAEALNTKAQQPLPRADMTTLQVHPGMYLNTVAIKRQSGQTLPVRVEHDGVRMMASTPQNLQEIGDLITDASGIPVSFSSDVFDLGDSVAAAGEERTTTGTTKSADALSAALDAALPKTSTVKDKAHQPAVFAGTPSGSSRERMRINYKGPLSGFLNQVAAYFDIDWSYRDGRLQFSRQVTRTFQLVAMPSVMDSSSQLNAGMSQDGGSGGSSGSSPGIQAGSNQTASVSVKLDFWKDLDATLKTMIGKNGNYSTSRSGSSVTVTGPSSMVERVAKYVQDLNRQLLRQVAVKVEVYTVKLDQKSDWNINLSGPFSAGAGFIKGTFGLESSDVKNTLINGTVKDTNALIRAMDSQGKVSVVTRTSVTTMSGQPVPLQVSNTRGYVSSISSTVDDNKSTTYTVEQSTVNSGFSINVLPKVMDDGKVLLQYSMNISTLVGTDDGFTNYMYGDKNNPNKVQLANVDQRSFIQEGVINNGNTLVLAGYEKNDQSAGDVGVGSPNFKLPAGSRTGEGTREVMVICITPVVLDHSAANVALN